MVAVVAVLVVTVAVTQLWAAHDGRNRVIAAADLGGATPDFDFVIPAGTADQLAHGIPVDIIPNPLEVEVGQVIRIRNDDTQPELVGPFYVAAGQTMVQRFVSAGRLEGTCRLHPSGELVVDIRKGRG